MYRVLILGEHLKMDISGQTCFKGFYTTRFFKSSTVENACEMSIESIRNDPNLVSLILNDPDDPPRFSVDEIEEIPESEVPESNPGFVLFDDSL
jgi:hypothetical protein